MADMRYQPQGLVRPSVDNPIARGLVLSVQAGAGVREVLSGRLMSGRGAAQSIKAVEGGLAFDLRGTNTAAFINVAGAADALAGDQTVVFDLVFVGAYSGTAPSIGGLWRSTAQNDSWLALDRTSADALTLSFRIGGANSTRVFNIGASTLHGRRLTIAASIYRGDGRILRMRVASAGQTLQDIEVTYSAAGNTALTPTGTEYLSIGSESVENASRNPNCIVYSEHHFSRVLDASEVASLSAAPWQLYADAQEDDFYSAPASGGAIAITPASLLLGGGEVAMRVTRRLVAQPAAMAIESGPVALSASRKLAVQAAALGETGGEVGLRALRQVSISGAELTLQSGDAQLRAARRLTVAPIDMAIAGGSIQFVYRPTPEAGSYVMAVTPAALAITAGNVTMRVTRRMPVAPAALAVAASEVRLLAGRRMVVGTAGLSVDAGAVLMRAARRLQLDPVQLAASSGAVTLRYSAQIEYARAPVGPGYSPQRVEVRARPAQTGGFRPPATQRNNR